MRKVKVAILGAGSGGLSARREVAKVTDDYVVIDGGTLGTTCARVGCMPSKVLIQVAQDYDRRHKFDESGILGAQKVGIDHTAVMVHVRKLRDRFVRGVTGGMESWDNNNLIRKYAKFIDANTLDLGDEKIQAEKIVIATGTTPSIPPQLKDYGDFLVTSDTFFELDTLPKSMAVVGLGVIGIELGQALHQLGVNTIGIARRKNIAGVSDPKLNDYVIEKFQEKMNLTFSGISHVEKINNQLKITSGEKEYLVDKVLVTSGRSSNLNKLNLECLEVNLDKKGVPLHSDETFALKDHNHIFLAGDTTGGKQVLHEASDEGRIAGYNCVNPMQKFKTRTSLLVTFSDPNIVSVGKTYAQLEDSNTDFAIGEVSFEGQGRSIVKLKECGLLRVYGDKKTGKLLGSELFAPDGEHLGHLLSWAIAQNLNVNQVLAMPFYHPVIEEGLRTALRDLRDNLDIEIPQLEIYKI